MAAGWISQHNAPAHLGGIGSGALIALQQSGLALGVATLGSLYLTMAPHGYPDAFATVECVQMGISRCSPSAPPHCRGSPRPVPHRGRRQLNP